MYRESEFTNMLQERIEIGLE